MAKKKQTRATVDRLMVRAKVEEYEVWLEKRGPNPNHCLEVERNVMGLPRSKSDPVPCLVFATTSLVYASKVAESFTAVGATASIR